MQSARTGFAGEPSDVMDRAPPFRGFWRTGGARGATPEWPDRLAAAGFELKDRG